MSSDIEKVYRKLKGTGGNEDWATWTLSGKLFGKCLEIWDFEMEDYIYFLDHVRSVQDLITGLDELSPFADDALKVARMMSESEFVLFKLALIKERQDLVGGSMPVHLTPLVLPEKILEVMMRKMPEEFGTSLGVVLVRLLEVREAPHYQKFREGVTL